MKNRSHPTRVVITGASSGIGAATAVEFARRGGHLVLGARDVAGLEDIADRCRAAGGHAQVRIVDVTDSTAVAEFAHHARDVLGEIDLWFSDVGIGVVGKFHDVPIADHRQVIDANLIGHMNDAHAVVPIFIDQGHGIWVNMISIGGFVPTAHAAAYAASKFGLRGFSQALRGELSKHPRIHICDVYPTFVDTPASGHAANYTGAAIKMPPGALQPETVATAVVRLATRPRNTTAVGAPSLLMQLVQLLAPNLSAATMSGFMDTWSADSKDRASDTTGSFYDPPNRPSGIHGPGRRSGNARTLQIAAGAAVGAAVLAAWWWQRRPARNSSAVFDRTR
jgi:short-subunit dehydrogenase